MKERPILFSSEMVRAILDGRKTQTRRVVKGITQEVTPLGTFDCIKDVDGLPSRLDMLNEESELSPYGDVGDRLWVRETWSVVRGRGKNATCFTGSMKDDDAPSIPPYSIRYKASEDGSYWRPSIYMPRWASRITLEVVNVRVERVQDISEDDALSEGVETAIAYPHSNTDTACDLFRVLWDSINAKRGHSWQSNPWVWVVEFTRVEA